MPLKKSISVVSVYTAASDFLSRKNYDIYETVKDNISAPVSNYVFF